MQRAHRPANLVLVLLGLLLASPAFAAPNTASDPTGFTTLAFFLVVAGLAGVARPRTDP